MPTDLPIMVAGLGRCGSSLVMQILSAAGLPCLGEYPSFECDAVNIGRDIPKLLSMRGTAMKILDPHQSEWPVRFDAKIIWLNRDPTNQAKSQIKFLRLASGMSIPGGAWRLIRSSLKVEKMDCCKWWNHCRTEPLFVSFEDLLLKPTRECMQIAAFVGAEYSNALPDCVLKRSPTCAKDLSIESLQIAQAEHESWPA